MDKCQIQQVTGADVVRAARDAQTAYDGFQQQGYLPADGQLYSILGYDSRAEAASMMGDIIIEPITASCMPAQEIAAVIAHEVGHINDPLAMLALTQQLPAVQVLILTAAGAVIGFRALKTVGMRAVGHRRPKHIKDAPALTLALGLHALVGMHAADRKHQTELAADRFAVQVMQDPEPLISALDARHNVDYGPNGGFSMGDLIDPQYWTTAASITLPKLALYGPVGMFFTYPSDEVRAERARAVPLTGQRPTPSHIMTMALSDPRTVQATPE